MKESLLTSCLKARALSLAQKGLVVVLTDRGALAVLNFFSAVNSNDFLVYTTGVPGHIGINGIRAFGGTKLSQFLQALADLDRVCSQLWEETKHRTGRAALGLAPVNLDDALKRTYNSTLNGRWMRVSSSLGNPVYAIEGQTGLYRKISCDAQELCVYAPAAIDVFSVDQGWKAIVETSFDCVDYHAPVVANSAETPTEYQISATLSNCSRDDQFVPLFRPVLALSNANKELPNYWDASDIAREDAWCLARYSVHLISSIRLPMHLSMDDIERLGYADQAIDRFLNYADVRIKATDHLRFTAHILNEVDWVYLATIKTFVWNYMTGRSYPKTMSDENRSKLLQRYVKNNPVFNLDWHDLYDQDIAIINREPISVETVCMQEFGRHAGSRWSSDVNKGALLINNGLMQIASANLFTHWLYTLNTEDSIFWCGSAEETFYQRELLGRSWIHHGGKADEEC